MSGLKRVLAAAVVLLAVSGGVAHAADEEIQVYEDDLDRPGQFGLDTHINYVFANNAGPDYPGQQLSVDRIRITPEWSYGLTRNVELGLYLPLADFRNNQFTIDGYKMRVKFIAPHPDSQNWYWGANFEIGQVDKRLDINPWNAELKGIWGVRKGPWTLAANLNVDWMVSGPEHSPVDVQVATKAAYKLDEDTAIGVESYNGLGGGRDFGRLSGADHQTYLVLDKGLGKWDLNLGVGYGYGRPEDRWMVKAVVGVPIS